jgi:hypothetical protein
VFRLVAGVRAAMRASVTPPSSRPTSPVLRLAPQGTPEGLPYPILRRLSSTSESCAAPRSIWLGRFCHEFYGSVANCCESALGGELSVAGGGLRGQRVELFGRGEALLDPTRKLPFAQHVHQFDANQGGLRRVKRFEPEHGTGDPLYSAMVLFHDV